MIGVVSGTRPNRDGDRHTSYLSSPCAQKAIDRYLIYLALPRPGAVCRG
jgi:hypothetical protein